MSYISRNQIYEEGYPYLTEEDKKELKKKEAEDRRNQIKINDMLLIEKMRRSLNYRTSIYKQNIQPYNYNPKEVLQKEKDEREKERKRLEILKSLEDAEKNPFSLIKYLKSIASQHSKEMDEEEERIQEENDTPKEKMNFGSVLKKVANKYEIAKKKPKPKPFKISTKQTKTFLTDEILYQYKLYEKRRQKLTLDELETFPDFRVKDFFDKDKLEKQINSKAKIYMYTSKSKKSPTNSSSKLVTEQNQTLLKKKKSSSKKKIKLPNIKQHTLLDSEYKKLDETILKKLREVKSLKHSYPLEQYQEKMMNLIKDNFSSEILRELALSFREISEKTLNKNTSKIDRRRNKGPKTRMELTLEKIAPFIPEYLYEKLKSIK